MIAITIKLLSLSYTHTNIICVQNLELTMHAEMFAKSVKELEAWIRQKQIEKSKTSQMVWSKLIFFALQCSFSFSESVFSFFTSKEHSQRTFNHWMNEVNNSLFFPLKRKLKSYKEKSNSNNDSSTNTQIKWRSGNVCSILSSKMFPLRTRTRTRTLTLSNSTQPPTKFLKLNHLRVDCENGTTQRPNNWIKRERVRALFSFFRVEREGSA
jgi:hypothetical protein